MSESSTSSSNLHYPEVYSEKSSNRKHKPSSSVKLFFKQLWILLWKSSITRRVHFISTIFEVIGPLLLAILVAVSYNKVSKPDTAPVGLKSYMPFENKSFYIGPSIYKKDLFEINFLKEDFINSKSPSRYKVFFTPVNVSYSTLLKSLIESEVEVQGFHDEQSLKNAIHKVANETEQSSIQYQVIGINFLNVNLDKGQVSYKILLPGGIELLNTAKNLYPIKFNQSPSKNVLLFEMFAKVSSYVNRDFLFQICDHHKRSECSKLLNKIGVKRMPYPRYKSPKISEDNINARDLLGIMMVYGYILLCPLIVKRITDEKATKAKELLRLIGMSDFVFWSSHFINYFIIIVLHAFALLFILFGFENPLLIYSSKSFFVFIFILYGSQLILFSMLITTVFNKPVLSVIITSIAWILSASLIIRFLNPTFISGITIAKTTWLRIVSSFLPTGSLMWYISLIGHFEQNETGLGWLNMNTKTSLYLDFTALTVTIAVISSFFVYAFLIWYLDNVWPFQHGVPKSPIFFLKPSYWFPKHEEPKNLPISSDLNGKHYEPDPTNLKPSIVIQDLCKSYGTILGARKTAVDHLTLNIYKNQITVLLGHNGAGKTTTMNMITGMFNATSGEIFVNKYNVFTQTNNARRNIGLCPQENIIFNELTVFQHLKLFAILKDYPYSKVNKEVKKILKLLKLEEKKKVLANNLSGGMKRKLSLGIALVGDTGILILDEPTSGMDPEARRVIWDLLISIRRKRTILLTTHYMEEADVLGDRIAILNEGKLCCSGSPVFLKNVFGTGYQLRIEKLTGFNSQLFGTIIKKYIPNATLRSEIETEVIYNINSKENSQERNYSPNFSALFSDIESNKKAYRINSLGMSYSSLEDVFLKVGSDNVNKSNQAYSDESSDTPLIISLTRNSELEKGSALLLNQLQGLLMKRFHFARRYWPMIIFQIIIPSLVIMFTMKIDSLVRDINSNEDLEVNIDVLKNYGPGTETFYSGEKTYFNSFSELNTEKYEANVNFIKSGDVDKWVINRTNYNLDTYIKKYIYGLQVRDSSTYIFKAWINSEPIVSMPLSIKNLFETILRFLCPHLKNLSGIDVFYHPVIVDKNQENLPTMVIIFSWVLTCLIFLPIAFPFLAASYVLFPIQENSSKSKLLQMMTNLSPAVYWISNFIFDLFIHVIAITILYGIILYFDTDGLFKHSAASGFVLFLILFAFGIGTIPLVYACSYFFKKPSSGFVFLIIIFLLFGFIANLVMSIRDIMNNFFGLDLMESAESLLYFFRLVPIFSMLFGYQKVYKFASFSRICQTLIDRKQIDEYCAYVSTDSSVMLKGCCEKKCGDLCFLNFSPFAFTKYGSGIEICFLIVSGLCYFVLIILYETYKQQIFKFLSLLNISYRFKSQEVLISNDATNTLVLTEDSDVVNENNNIKNAIEGRNEYLLCVDQLTKKFDNFTAVDHLSFSVHYNECFGLLGVNGAGKTTTFSMLTGDLFPTSGNAFLEKGRLSLISNMSNFQSRIGYCPQFDALLNKLTGIETLYLYAYLRGIPKKFIKRDVTTMIQMVGLQAHAKKLVENYSGGNRRKLSIALALIGNPSILFLDEPTAGVDPAARRKIWESLGIIKKNFNCSIILTSHSMEECEALCSRIAIMVNGKFRCLGSTQHLRTKYGQGYTVLIRLQRSNESNLEYVQNIQDELIRLIPSAVLKDYHQCLMQFHITDPKETWSNLFKNMSHLDENFHFEDYIVSDTTLESIFIMFARFQKNNIEK